MNGKIITNIRMVSATFENRPYKMETISHEVRQYICTNVNTAENNIKIDSARRYLTQDKNYSIEEYINYPGACIRPMMIT
jgi:hypothetical protein